MNVKKKQIIKKKKKKKERIIDEGHEGARENDQNIGEHPEERDSASTAYIDYNFKLV